jgi:hypothetical protein
MHHPWMLLDAAVIALGAWLVTFTAGVRYGAYRRLDAALPWLLGAAAVLEAALLLLLMLALS